MRCPLCHDPNSRVLESRSAESGKSIRRRRECMNCQNRFTSYERIEFVPITVIKRDGKRESFDKSKLLRGIIRACEKTGIAAAEIEKIADEIESELQGRSHREVASSDIGESVLKQLRRLSEVAYVRFASVYRQFQGIRDFVEALDHLQSDQDANIELETTQEAIADSESPTSESRQLETHASCATPN